MQQKEPISLQSQPHRAPAHIWSLDFFSNCIYFAITATNRHFSYHSQVFFVVCQQFEVRQLYIFIIQQKLVTFLVSWRLLGWRRAVYKVIMKKLSCYSCSSILCVMCCLQTFVNSAIINGYLKLIFSAACGNESLSLSAICVITWSALIIKVNTNSRFNSQCAVVFLICALSSLSNSIVLHHRYLPLFDLSDEYELTNYESTVLFTVASYQYLILVVVFSKGAPYRRSMVTNCKHPDFIVVFWKFHLLRLSSRFVSSRVFLVTVFLSKQHPTIISIFRYSFSALRIFRVIFHWLIRKNLDSEEIVPWSVRPLANIVTYKKPALLAQLSCFCIEGNLDSSSLRSTAQTVLFLYALPLWHYHGSFFFEFMWHWFCTSTSFLSLTSLSAVLFRPS